MVARCLMPPMAAEGRMGEASTAPSTAEDLLPDEADLLYEEELLRNPYALKMWFRYLDARKTAPPSRRYVLYERALHALPGSYKVRCSRWWA